MQEEAVGKGADFDNSAEVIVKGLGYHVTEDQIWEFFGAYGTVSTVKCLSKEDGSFRGVCFIKYSEQAGVDAAVAASGAQFEGRSVWIEKTKPKGQREQEWNSRGGNSGGFQRGGDRPQRGGNRFGGNDRGSFGGGYGGGDGGDKFHTNQDSTVFVGNLSFNTGEDAVWGAFDKIGNIKEVRLGKNPDGSVIYAYSRAKDSPTLNSMMLKARRRL